VRVVGAYGLSLMSEDGGRQWRSLVGELDNPKGRHHYAITGLAQGVMLIAGEQGQILRSEAPGAPFRNLGQQGLGTFFGLLATPQVALAYGLRGAVYRSGDTGRSWDKLSLPPVTLSAAVALNDTTLVLVDESGRRWRSDDAGLHFTALPGELQAPVSAAVLAADGSLVLAGVGGLTRVPVAQLKSKEARP
jgi:photosystem II stability/assembly factor-like uncharacterized protein